MHRLIDFVGRRFNQSIDLNLFLSKSSRMSIGHLDSNLDILDMVWTTFMEPRHHTSMISQILLVPLIMLSHNHQNHKRWPNKPCFLQLQKDDIYIWMDK